MARHDDVTEIQGIPRASRDGLRVIAMWSGAHVSRDLPDDGTIVIGRAPDVDLVIDHASVSRRHATLTIERGAIRIEDHGSANGTFLDGTKLDPESAVSFGPGSVVELGAAMIVVRGRAPVAATPAPEVDPAMAEVYELIDVVAQSKLTVLLVGETGVGKEVLAARVHSASTRADQPFLKLNCAALVENLLESELFGHERGAFTGATQAKVGLAEAAQGGTLFLDEVGELTPALQAKLLRLLENGEITRVGGVRAIPVDVRFVCATNRSLPEMVEKGTFRNDLYFRLDGLTINVPPLRERRAEVRSLAEQFAKEASEGRVALSADAMDRLLAHDWPGNVRELKNVIARSVLFCRGDTLVASDLRIETDAPRSSRSAAPDDRRQRVLDALEKNRWNQSRAAEQLGVSRRTLHNWLDELGIPRARGKKT